jgi:hypothetical protein
VAYNLILPFAEAKNIIVIAAIIISAGIPGNQSITLWEYLKKE